MITMIPNRKKPLAIERQHPEQGKEPNKIQILVSPDTAAAFIAGNQLAFEEVFFVYYPKVKYFLELLVKSDEVAEDLTQEVFVRLWKTRSTIDVAGNFNTHIFSIARTFLYRYAESVSGVITSNVPESDEDSTTREIELVVGIAVSRMPKRRRRVFELSRNANLSNEMIARKLHISRNAVNKHMNLAKKDIQEVIAIMSAFTVLIN